MCRPARIGVAITSACREGDDRGQERIRVGPGWECRSHACGWTPAIVVPPIHEGRTEMSLVHRISQSRHSRRIVPISRSQNAFAGGVRAGVFSTCRPIELIAGSTVAE